MDEAEANTGDPDAVSHMEAPALVRKCINMGGYCNGQPVATVWCGGPTNRWRVYIQRESFQFKRGGRLYVQNIFHKIVLAVLHLHVHQNIDLR